MQNQGLGAQYELIKFSDFNQLLAKARNNRPLNIANMRDKLDALFVVHGTFVGNDPFNLLELNLLNTIPFNKQYKQIVRRFNRKINDIFLGDFGNFSSEHIKRVNHDFKSSIAYLYDWSSGNNHFSRLIAAIGLINDIAQVKASKSLVASKKNIRYLLIGHSHAGQVFALITQLLNNQYFLNFILKQLTPIYSPNFTNELLENIRLLEGDSFTFLTLGTPIGYKWAISDKCKVIHVINHRGKNLNGGSFRGAIFTRGGDYIQQWAAIGSDLGSMSKKVNRFNKELDEWLGFSKDRKDFVRNILRKKRLHDFGKNYLIDFGDSAIYPNFILTGFGHGVYTRVKYLELYYEIISQNLA